MQAIDAVDHDLRRAQPRDLGPQRLEEAAEIDDLRLARRVLEDRAAPGQRRRHHHRLGRADRGARHGEGRADKAAAGIGDDVAVFEIDAGAQRFEALDMEIDRARADGAAAGQRNLGRTVARQERTGHLEARAHLAHDVVRRERGFDGRGVQADRVAAAQAIATPDVEVHAELHHQVGHGIHIGQARHVADRHRLVGQDRRRHELERRILGAADRNFTLEAVAAPDAYPVHCPSGSGRRPLWRSL